MNIFYEDLKNTEPPVSAIEMLKFNCPDWIDEHMQK